MINAITLRLKFSHFELRSSNVSFVSEAAPLYISIFPPKQNTAPPPPPPHTHTLLLLLLLLLLVS